MSSRNTIMPLCRELAEIAYLWHEPHQIDGGKLAAAIGDVPHTPLDVAVTDALRNLGTIAGVSVNRPTTGRRPSH
jgi:hypothetical protein